MFLGQLGLINKGGFLNPMCALPFEMGLSVHNRQTVPLSVRLPTSEDPVSLTMGGRWEVLPDDALEGACHSPVRGAETRR